MSSAPLRQSLRPGRVAPAARGSNQCRARLRRPARLRHRIVRLDASARIGTIPASMPPAGAGGHDPVASMPAAIDPESALAATRAWVEHLVVGLNLCPFAAQPFNNRTIRYAVCEATQPLHVAERLAGELALLADADPAIVQTTLLILPNAFADFLEFNDFLDVADALVEEAGLGGVLQVASFHPGYCFADEPPDDLSHWTNRAPHPVLHLIREDDIERAAAAHPDVDGIPDANIARLHALGRPAIEALLERCRAAGDAARKPAE